MQFGLCYIPDYHEELSGSWQDWYDNMIAEVKLAEVTRLRWSMVCGASRCWLRFWLARAVHRGLRARDTAHPVGLRGSACCR